MKYVLVVIVIIILALYLFYLIGGMDYRKEIAPIKGKLKVSCVGDSITYGCLVMNQPVNNYPVVLNEMLKDCYYVNNYGVNNHTLSSKGDEPYIKNEQYEKSKTNNPSIVVIMLGTNDTKKINWISEQHFKEEYLKLIESYRLNNPEIRIIVMTPIPVISKWNLLKPKEEGLFAWDITSYNLEKVVKVTKEVALEQHLELIDANAYFTNQKEWFSFDGVHTNKKGAYVLASLVAKTIKEKI